MNKRPFYGVKCEYCGRFISNKDFASGKASTESWVAGGGWDMTEPVEYFSAKHHACENAYRNQQSEAEK